jgi:hypothetical protein
VIPVTGRVRWLFRYARYGCFRISIELAFPTPTPPSAPSLPSRLSGDAPGNQGSGPDAEAVLTLILEEGAEAVVHQGDFDYNDDPAGWEAQIDAVLGPDFPYFASVGNHDAAAFYGSGGYQEVLMRRMERLGIP